MKFKKANWKPETETREHVDLAFGLEGDVWEYKGACIWSIGDKYSTYSKGRAKGKEQAKSKAEHAFHQYVMENLEKCTEEEVR